MMGLHHLLLTAALALPAVPSAPADPGSVEVTGVSVHPSSGRTEIVIHVSGPVDVRDFTLENPDRLVLDFGGARLQGGGSLYDGVNRGGIRDIRYSQFRPDTVRVVLEMDAMRPYRVERSGDAVRVSFDGAGGFAVWRSAAPEEPLAEVIPPADAVPVQTASFGTTSPLPAQPAPAGTEASLYGSDEPRITVTWDRASIADVVAGFAALSGRTIILGKGIQGEVTAEIKDQPWDQAFRAILAAQGLSAQEMPGGIIRVDAPATLAALDSLEPLSTEIVRVNYKQAGALVKSIESILTKGRGRVVADTGSNALIVTDTRSHLPGVVEFIEALDTRTPQVAIQAKIIFVDRTDIQQLGLQYDLGHDDDGHFFNKIVQRRDPFTGEPFDPNVTSVNLGGTSVAAIANADAIISGSALDVVFTTAMGEFTLTSFLSALERQELSDVQAEPLISTLDNQTADILVGEEVPVRVIDASSAGSGTGARATVQFKETGIRLTVTPHVTNNGQILMELRTERSDLQLLSAAASDLGFIVQKQQAENQLLVDDGETAVIGGLTVTEVTHNRSGIPILSRIPVLGKLFSFTDDQERRRDLIILVTPRIVDDGMSMGG